MAPFGTAQGGADAAVADAAEGAVVGGRGTGVESHHHSAGAESYSEVGRMLAAG